MLCHDCPSLRGEAMPEGWAPRAECCAVAYKRSNPPTMVPVDKRADQRLFPNRKARRADYARSRKSR